MAFKPFIYFLLSMTSEALISFRWSHKVTKSTRIRILFPWKIDFSSMTWKLKVINILSHFANEFFMSLGMKVEGNDDKFIKIYIYALSFTSCHTAKDRDAFLVVQCGWNVKKNTLSSPNIVRITKRSKRTNENVNFHGNGWEMVKDIFSRHFFVQLWPQQN